MWIPSTMTYLSLLDSIVRSAERLREGELCSLGHRRKVSVLCLLYEIYNRVDHSMNKCLKHFVAARNTTVSAALCEMALVIPRCRTRDDSFYAAEQSRDAILSVFPACCCASMNRDAVGRI